MKAVSIETTTHGRVLVQDAAGSARGLLVGFHGYAQNAEDMLAELERIPASSEWTLAAVQGLHRFYTRGDERVVASWMTRQDRELAIADNIAYIDRAVATLLDGKTDTRIVFAGFSQGVAMAYRAAVLGTHGASGLIAIGGDVPPEVKTAPAESFPPVLVAVGETDFFYTRERVNADEAFLKSHGVRSEVFRYAGGHEWTDPMRNRLSAFLTRV